MLELDIMSYHKLSGKVDTIISLYKNGSTAQEIADKFSCDPSAIYYHLRKEGIRRTERWERIPKQKLTDKQWQLCFGGLLGDAYMPPLLNKQKNHRITFSQSVKQSEYLRWKHAIMKPFSNKINIVGKKYKQIRFNTKAHPIFKEFKQMLYPNGKKVLPDLKKIDDFGLAIWFMDDGSKSGTKIRFATNSFTQNENKLIADFFNERWGIKAYVRKHRQSGTHYIDLSRTDRDKFCKTVEPHIINSMKYKIN